MKNKNRYIKVKGFLPLFFLITLFACKKESTEIGVGVIGDGGVSGIDSVFTDITTRTVLNDSSRTDNLSSNIIGVINDPVLGLSKANLIVQPRLTQFGNTTAGETIDSIKLILKYDNTRTLDTSITYGDLGSEIVLEVYKLDEDLIDTAKYYSNYIPILGDKVGAFTGVFNVTDTTSLEITLDNTFGQEMLDLGDDAYGDNDGFLNALKGFAIVPKSTTISGDGAIVAVNSGTNSSKLVMYYKDTLTKEIPMGSSSKRVNYYENIPSAILAAQISGSGDFNNTYTQSLGGTKIKIDVPGLESIIKLGDNIVINEAKITLLLDDVQTTANYRAPVRMWLLVPDSTNTKLSIPIVDLFDDLVPPSGWTGLTSYGGDYNSSIVGYEFHFNRYLQELVRDYANSGQDNFNGFYLSVPTDFPITPYRGIFKTDKSSKDIKVSVTYTKLN